MITHVMQLVVESARVADGLAVVVAPPQSRVRGAAVGARHADASVAVSGLHNKHNSLSTYIDRYNRRSYNSAYKNGLDRLTKACCGFAFCPLSGGLLTPLMRVYNPHALHR